MGNDFVHLHVHSEYSLLDGACRIKELVKYIKEMGQTAVAVTDHGCLYAAIEFYMEAKENGIKPIIGCEVYVAPRSRHDKLYGVDNKPYHLVLLCENNEGYHNLVKLVSLGYTEGFYNKPRVDMESLRKYSGGLIALSACIAGEIPRLLINGEYENAKAAAMRYNDIFGRGNFFIEIQNHGIKEEMQIMPLLYKLSAETGIPLAATNDAHYITKQDEKIQKVLVAIQTNTPLSKPSPLNFPTNEFYIKSYDEMSRLFSGRMDMLENTVKIAERCNVSFEFGVIKLPKYEIPGVSDNIAYFKKLATDGFYSKYGYEPPEEYVERLKYELDVVIKMGYVDYYLIVWDFVNFAKTHDIPVGPGRGSGAGSIIAYCIGITGVDPMKYNLLFERFLNPERVSMPDFDIDFCGEQRQRVIDYVVNKYGSDRVAQIITFGTMAAKAAVKDVGRVMELPYQTVDNVSKLIPSELHTTLDSALASSAELKKLYMSDSKVHELIDVAKKIEGMPRHASTNAAGIVICDRNVNDYVPVQSNDEYLVTQYPKTILEILGLLKMDFLALRTLTVIDYTVKAVKKTDPGFNIDKIPLDDKNVFDMLSAGDAYGVFQFESAGIKQVLSRLKPTCIEDLIAVLSLYRPGPMDSISKYIENRHHPEKIKYKHPLLEDILDVTYGCIVYQEQVMQICRKLAGYSYGRADLVRRAMAKKKADIMEKERDVFISGAVKNGVPESVAEDIFNEMSGFASYAFNKSHAAAYAHLSYQTAYLKCYYYSEYMSALMTSVMDNQNKLMEYISECKKNGLKILRPDVNLSMAGFTADKGGIRFALLAVKNLGSNANKFIKERETNGLFTSLSDFCKRMNGRDVNKKAAENLIKCGAFDSFKLNRHQMLENYDKIFGELQDSVRNNIEGQMSFFEAASGEDKSADSLVPYVPEFDLGTLLEFEKEASGMYISGHPLEQYMLFAAADRVTNISDIYNEELYPDGKIVKLLCILQDVKQYKTKNGSAMAFVSAEDMTGECEMLFFSDVYDLNVNIIKRGGILFVKGKISRKDEVPKIIAETVLKPTDYIKTFAKRTLYVKCSSTDREQIQNVLDICKNHKGDGKLQFYFSDMKKYVRPNNFEGVYIDEKLLEELGKFVIIDNIAVSE